MRSVKAAYDPDNFLRAGYNIRPRCSPDLGAGHVRPAGPASNQ
ncbi:hypothetical protein ACIA5D_45340 [Actinoplanes sp. NPDC051513]